MSEYNPKAPNELADAQLQRENYESDASKDVAKNGGFASSGATLEHTEDDAPNTTERKPYNSVPGE